jgi:protein transport protein HofQ/type IV pilus assembly protein PilQ
MRNGETLVIGGLISEEEQKQLQQIPFLSKIPLLGALFRNHYKSKSRTEVIMLLTPYLTEAGQSPAIFDDTLLPVLKSAAVP